MQYNFENIDELIAKRLTGEIGDAEQVILMQWLQTSEVNQQYYDQMQQLWQKSVSAQTVLEKNPDIEAALNRTKSKIRQASSGGKAKRIGINTWWLGMAASLALLAAAIWFFQSKGDTSAAIYTTLENTQLDTLSDGSTIALNQHSGLTTAFDKKARRIKMHGEAYFEVTKNPEKPFIIEVKEVEVTVVGTRFNVDNHSDSTKVVVSVEEGRVKVQIGTQIIFLNAGEQASIDCSNGAILRSSLPPAGNVKAWFDRRFIFDDVPLSEVIPILEKAYDVQIELKNKNLGNCRLHSRFNNEPISRVLSLIAETFSLKIESNNSRYLLDGLGCD